jgi:hypothetical protein
MASSSSGLLALSSLLFGSGALWYGWLLYTGLVKRPDSYWYNWVQIAGIALVGVLCLWAGTLFFFGRPSARAVFKLGVSIVPILLFSNLMMLLFKVVQNIFQGNASFFFERVFAQPYKLLFLLLIVIAITVLGSLNEKRGQ